MMTNFSQPFKNKLSSNKNAHTLLSANFKRADRIRVNKSLIKNKENKLSKMLKMNQKYERELLNNYSNKDRQLNKYFSKKPLKISRQKLSQNLTPIKLHKNISAKEKYSIKNHMEEAPQKHERQNKFALFGKNCTQKRIIQNESSLLEVPENEVIISSFVQDSYKQNLNESLIGYWIGKNKLVSLFPVNNRKIDKVSVINHPDILPMLGCLAQRKKEKRVQKYIITELYQANSLRDIRNEFGTLNQDTVKIYLRKIILCLQNLHKNRIAHNRLSLDAFATTETGEILLNMLKSCVKPLSEKERFSETYHFPPEMLLSKTNSDSMKNDVWAVGCIALQLLTSYELKSNPYHPYNHLIDFENFDTVDSPAKQNTVQISKKQIKNSNFLITFQNSKQPFDFNLMKDSSSILQRVRELIQIDSKPKTVQEGLLCSQLCQSIILEQISHEAADFIKKCLNIKLYKRPSIDELMFHSFLK